MTFIKQRHALCALAAVCAAPSIWAAEPAPDAGPNVKPAWLGAVSATTYDGVADDLLTGGLGASGLLAAFPFGSIANPLAPTPAELRRLAIHTNYRAVLDILPAGGYGTLYGPNVTASGTITTDSGKIPGTEYIAYAGGDDESNRVVLMVQVPAGFDPTRPCIVTGTSSGSRGIYGAIGSSGEWGLKRGCAVAYTDKGTGAGVHDLKNDTVHLIDGTRTTADAAGAATHFTARLSDARQARLNAATPNRIAVKHAHSQVNPEKDWGRDTLRAVRFAFYVLNEQFGMPLPDGAMARTITPANTTVIAASISNGAGAALAAAEQDDAGLIDGVAVTEPNIQLDTRLQRVQEVVIRRGSLPDYTGSSKPLLDYFTFANLYQPCAALSSRAAASALPFPATFVPLAQARCTSLFVNGLLTAADPAAQAEEALDRLLAYGWEPETIPLQVSHWRFATPAIAMTYANAHGRFSVADHLCGLSFAYTDAATGFVIPPQAGLATIFGLFNGVPPSSGIGIVNNLNPAAFGGARLDTLSASPSSNRFDFNLDAAMCQRELITGSSAQALRVQQGIRQVQQRGDLRGKPALIVHGRVDTLVPVNFSSRPYYAVAKRNAGRDASISYIEVTNAQHFDAFLGFPGYSDRFVPLHVYFNRALDAMYAHLTEGAPLPPSQVVRTTPRGAGAPPITAANVPNWSGAPRFADRIRLQRETLVVPD